MRERLDDHPRTVWLERLVDVNSCPLRVSHVVQTVEEGHKIIGSWIALGRCDLEPRVAGHSGFIARYLAALDRADRQDDEVAEAKTVRLKEKIEGLRRQMQSLKEMGEQVEAAPDKQVSLTDPDAVDGDQRQGHRYRRLQCPGGRRCRAPSDRRTRGHQHRQRPGATDLDGEKALDATGCEQLTVLADRGYYNGDEVLACEGTGVLPCIPKTQTSGNAKRGLFTVADFIYDAEKDRYTCPASNHLTRERCGYGADASELRRSGFP